MYSPEEIFERCPESIRINGKIYTTYEWTVLEYSEKSPYLLTLLDFLRLYELEEMKEKENIEKLRDICNTIILVKPSIVIKILKNLSGIEELEEKLVKKEHVELFFNLCKQNDIIQSLIRLKVNKDSPDSTKKYSIDIYDDLLEIIRLNLIGKDLTLLNWKEILTYRQLNWLRNKLENHHRRNMFNFYLPMIVGLGEAFASKDKKRKSFYDEIFKANDEQITTFEAERRQWFKEKWNDIAFCIERIEACGISPEKFFSTDDVKYLNIKKPISLIPE